MNASFLSFTSPLLCTKFKDFVGGSLDQVLKEPLLNTLDITRLINYHSWYTLQEQEIKQRTPDVQLHQPLPGGQHPGMMVGPEGPQGPSMGEALPGVPPNATSPTVQPPRPPLPSESEMEQPSPGAQQPQQPPSMGIVPGGATPNFGRSVNPISSRRTNYAHLIITGTPGFSDLPTALPSAQQPGMMVEPGGSQGPRSPTVGEIALLGGPPNNTMGQPLKPPLPSITYCPPQFNRDLKWKSDELLGDQGDTSMILYANKKHPNLKIEYPIFDDRIKQIAKIWRNLEPNKRRPYQTAAQENHRARCIIWQVMAHLLFRGYCKVLYNIILRIARNLL